MESSTVIIILGGALLAVIIAVLVRWSRVGGRRDKTGVGMPGGGALPIQPSRGKPPPAPSPTAPAPAAPPAPSPPSPPRQQQPDRAPASEPPSPSPTPAPVIPPPQAAKPTRPVPAPPAPEPQPSGGASGHPSQPQEDRLKREEQEKGGVQKKRDVQKESQPTRGGLTPVDVDDEVADAEVAQADEALLEDGLQLDLKDDSPEEEKSAPAPLRDAVHFTAFYPRTAQAERRYGLFAYAHRADALGVIQGDVAKFADELGGSVPAPRTAKQGAQVEAGQPITITPECEGLVFDPPTLTKRWQAPHIRYDFDFTPALEVVGEVLQGRLSIAIAGIEVSHLKFAIEVGAAGAQGTQGTQGIQGIQGLATLPQTTTPPPTNPLAAAKLGHTGTARFYNKIFVSYSRQDTQVAENYRLAQLALGNEVFMDTYSIRVGEDWRAALAKAIDSADIFQLFWSKHAAQSPNVRDEWDYALHFRCPDHKCTEFIRPVYWETPMPVSPPAELSHLNFRYVPLAAASS